MLRVRGLGKRGSVGGLDFEVPHGQTLGLAGLLGSGRTETARLLFGVDRADRGTLEFEGEPVRPSAPRSMIQRGLAFTPEDRRADGIVPNLSVRENIILAVQSKRGLWRKLPESRQREIADRFIKLLNIKTPDAEQLIKNLSGGNQQKVLLARWLAAEPRLFILDEPTRGIDVGAKAEIERLIRGFSDQGMSTVLISSEMEEIARLSQRVVVLRDRHQVGKLEGEQITEPKIMGLIAEPEEGTPTDA